MIKTSAPGKVILLGEHAVVYNKLGIATSIDKRAYVTVSPAKESVTIESKNLNLRKSLSEEELFKLLREIENLKIELKDKTKAKETSKKIKKIGRDKLLASFFVIAKLAERFGFHGLEISIDSKVPKNLGSSSSVFAAIVLGVSALSGKELSKKEISNIANEGDIVTHGGLPSGIDANTVTYGGYLTYRKNKGSEPLDINFKIPLLIIDSGEPAKTGETVPYINKLSQEKPELVEDILDKLDKISQLGLETMKSRNLEEMGRLMTNFYWELKKLDISTPKLDEIIRISLKNQAFGAKPTGGWGGGCCIVLAKNKNQEKKLLTAFKKSGFKAFQTKLGVEGVRIEKEYKKRSL